VKNIADLFIDSIAGLDDGDSVRLGVGVEARFADRKHEPTSYLGGWSAVLRSSLSTRLCRLAPALMLSPHTHL
jgi:hypothetical protein